MLPLLSFLFVPSPGMLKRSLVSPQRWLIQFAIPNIAFLFRISGIGIKRSHYTIMMRLFYLARLMLRNVYYFTNTS